MCLLTYFPAEIMPDAEALYNGAIFNDDGHGYAIVDPSARRIIVDRGMDAKEMIKSFVEIRRLYSDGPALFHSRMATDGVTNLLNCHPFPIGGDSRTVLAHNGIMPVRPSTGDYRSDTRIVAEDYIPRAFGTLRRRRARLAFERWLRPYNKVVILTVDPRYRDHAFILNEDEGIWDGGAWYSNDMYRGFTMPGKSYQMMWWEDGDYPLTVTTAGSKTSQEGCCWACQTSVDYALGECPMCGLCFDCGEKPDRCMCYVPTRRLRLDHQV